MGRGEAMLQQVYFWIRMVGYITGIIAVFLIIGGGETQHRIGYLLLLMMFALFCTSYVLYALIRRKR